MANVFGTFRAAVEEHLPLTVINDWNLNAADLAPYKVLILPNTACLDDAQAAAVDAVRRTGRRTGRQPGCLAVRRVRQPPRQLRPGARLRSRVPGPHRRRAPGKPERLDVNFAKSIGPDYWEKRKNVFDFKQDVGSFLNRGRMPTYVGDNQRDLQRAGGAGCGEEPAAKVVGTLG